MLSSIVSNINQELSLTEFIRIVEYATRDQAQTAVSTLSNQNLMGRLVYVREVTAPKKYSWVKARIKYSSSDLHRTVKPSLVSLDNRVFALHMAVDLVDLVDILVDIKVLREAAPQVVVFLELVVKFMSPM